MEGLYEFFALLNKTVYGPLFIGAALFGGLFFTLKLRGFQFTNLGRILKSTVGSCFKKGEGARSFKLSATALAGAIGVGNITGVGTAIALGGPGAVFWIWVSAFLLMSVKYSEIFIAMKYRAKNKNGETVGGPMYYISAGAGHKKLGAVFACLCLMSALLLGNMVQSNAIAVNFKQAFGVEPVITGVAVALLAGAVLIGGVKRVSSICGVLVPVFAALYIIGCIYVIGVNFENLPLAFASIFKGAFAPPAAAGASAWLAIRYGMARGVFTNEAGVGSSPIIHACSDQKNAFREGAWGVFEVFADTIVVCTATALAILSTPGSGDSPAGLAAGACFERAMPGLGQPFIAISIFFFAYSTILGWSFYGQKALEYLRPRSGALAMNLLFLSASAVGSVISVNLLWEAADIINAHMIVINVFALLLLSREIRFDARKL